MPFTYVQQEPRRSSAFTRRSLTCTYATWHIAEVQASPSADIEITPGPDDRWGNGTADFTFISGEGWSAHGLLVRTARGIVIHEIRVVAGYDEDGDPVSVTSSILRRIPTGEIIAAAIASERLPEPDTAEAQLRDRAREKRQPGRQPLSDELLLAVADGYLFETSPGRGRGAIQRLADHLGKPAPTVSRWVMRARTDGWLGPAVPGREGAEPGPKYINAVGAKMVGQAMFDWVHKQNAGQPET